MIESPTGDVKGSLWSVYGAFGLGVSTAMYRSYGYRNSQIATALVTQGVWNNFVKLGMPVIALVLLALSGEANAALIVASMIGHAVRVHNLVEGERQALGVGEEVAAQVEHHIAHFADLLSLPILVLLGGAARAAEHGRPVGDLGCRDGSSRRFRSPSWLRVSVLSTYLR